MVRGDPLSMREVILRVPRDAVEEVLDGLLPIVPGGVREALSGRHAELIMRGDDLPSRSELERVVARWPHELSERQAPDDWRQRQLADYEPDLIGERLVVRPEWAPAPQAPGVLDIVLSESAAFGVGSHPTTRTCLELLLEREPRGSFADLGCGTGVLAIAAAKLGWAPVVAVDVQPASVETTRANAAANGVTVEASMLDLAAVPPPVAEGLAANVPAWLHARVAAALPEAVPAMAVISGFVPGEAAGVLEAYGRRGLRPARQVEAHGWLVAVLEHDLRAAVR